MSIAIFFCQQMLLSVVPLLIVALGGIFSEKGGIINFSLEGLMLIGAFLGALYIRGAQMAGAETNSWTYFIALIIAGVAGAVAALMHGAASITLNGDQIISGISINLLMPALTIVIARAIIGVLQVSYRNTFIIREIPGLSKIPIIGPIFFQNAYVSTLVGLVVLIFSVIVFRYTRFGMRLQSCGENPQAAAATGIKVNRTRYIGLIISGFLAGMGGLAFVIPNATEYGATVAGYGYLAVAIVIFGQWQPMRILVASIFFGAMKTIANIYTTIPFLANLGVSNYIFKMIPYIATIIVLIFASQGNKQPKALGQPLANAGR